MRYLIFSDFFTGADMTLASVIWPLIAGVVIAVIVVFVVKRTTGRLVKALLDQKADSPETAKTLGELGFDRKPALRYSLRPNATLRKLVMTVPADGEGKPITGETRLYIPEDKAYRAETSYNPDGTSLLLLLLLVLMLLLAAAAVMTLVPLLVEWLSSALFR